MIQVRRDYHCANTAINTLKCPCTVIGVAIPGAGMATFNCVAFYFMQIKMFLTSETRYIYNVQLFADGQKTTTSESSWNQVELKQSNFDLI